MLFQAFQIYENGEENKDDTENCIKKPKLARDNEPMEDEVKTVSSKNDMDIDDKTTASAKDERKDEEQYKKLEEKDFYSDCYEKSQLIDFGGEDMILSSVYNCEDDEEREQKEQLSSTNKIEEIGRSRGDADLSSRNYSSSQADLKSSREYSPSRTDARPSRELSASRTDARSSRELSTSRTDARSSRVYSPSRTDARSSRELSASRADARPSREHSASRTDQKRDKRSPSVEMIGEGKDNSASKKDQWNAEDVKYVKTYADLLKRTRGKDFRVYVLNVSYRVSVKEFAGIICRRGKFLNNFNWLKDSGVNYASPSSWEAYRDRRLTTNFELSVEIFCVLTCFHVRIPKTVCLSVSTPRKEITLSSSISVLH